MNERQKRFVLEYLIDLNGTQAAIRTGYHKQAATRLMAQPAVKAAIQAGISERAERTRLTADRVLREYARIAFADIRRFTEGGPEGVRLRPVAELSDDDAAAIKEISAGGGRSGRAYVRLHDKKPALDAIARHIGLFGNEAAETLESHRATARRARAILKERLDALAKKV